MARGNLELKAIRLIRWAELNGIDPQAKTEQLENLFVDVTGRNENARFAFSEAMHALFGTATVTQPKRARKAQPARAIEQAEETAAV